MAESDDPQEELQVVAMTTGAAAARVAETVIRARQNSLQDHDGQQRSRTTPATPATPATPGAAVAETRDPEVVRARLVADAMNGRPVSEAARAVPTVQPARQVERILARESERSR